ncbi:MAG: DUF4190 domain-containing protein [Phycisphaera sp.]|nr:MAG: DUF4190 domain-containing protein [Phycisphaera sp.]
MPNQTSYQAPPSNGLGVAGFVCSLLGILGTCGLLCPVGLILSLFALRKPPRGLAIAGAIIGFIGSLWIIIGLIIFGIMFLAIFALAAAGTAITLPNIQTYVTMSEIHTEVTAYHQTMDALPDSLVSITTLKPDLQQDYWGNSIAYEIIDADSYKLTSAGADGTPNTDDDITLDFDVR